MSSFVRFTPLHPRDHDDVYTMRNSSGAGVRILDRDGLREDVPSPVWEQRDTRTVVDDSEYPGTQWELLLGFTTVGGDASEPGETPYHNVTNTDPKEMTALFARVSNHTEPFVVYMSNFNGAWPHAAELDLWDGTVYKGIVADGDAELRALTVGVTDESEVEW